MAEIIFFQKPGCTTNARQKRALEQAGHSVDARDLLVEIWTGERLRDFFGALPVAAWFNPAAPKIKSGAIDPASLDEESALALLVAEPLLIRRPLIETGNQKCAGFDNGLVAALLAGAETRADVGCARGNQAPCPNPRIEPLSARVPFRHINVAEAEKLIDGNSDVVILDVRDPISYRRGHLNGAHNVTILDLFGFIDRIPKDAPVLIYCYHGYASQEYAQLFSDFRYTRVHSLDGGYKAWVDRPEAATQSKTRRRANG